MVRRNKIEDPDYLDWIRTLPCCICGFKPKGKKPTGVDRHCAVHHVNGRHNDYSVVPLCDFIVSGYGHPNCHHDVVHKNMKKYRPILTDLAVDYRERYERDNQKTERA